MRVITVRQPWAWAIIYGGKDVENRSRNIAGAYRGPVAIHAGLAWDTSADDLRGDPSHPFGWAIASNEAQRDCGRSPVGAIIGVVDLVDVHTSRDCYHRNLRRLVNLYRNDRAACQALPDNGAGGLVGKVRLCSPWAMDDHLHLALSHPRPLVTPIPAKGRLGLWTPTPELVTQIEEALS